jgi:hypothetical protein
MLLQLTEAVTLVQILIILVVMVAAEEGRPRQWRTFCIIVFSTTVRRTY